MSMNLSDENTKTVIEKISDFAILYPVLFLIWLVLIVLTLIMLSKWSIKLFWKHQESWRDSIMDSKVNKEENE